MALCVGYVCGSSSYPYRHACAERRRPKKRMYIFKYTYINNYLINPEKTKKEALLAGDILFENVKLPS